MSAADAYGSINDQDYAFTGPRGQMQKPTRQRFNIFAICFGFFLPWIIFASVFCTMSFSLRHTNPAVSNGLSFLLLLFVLFFGYLAYDNSLRRKAGDVSAGPNWYMFIFVTGLLAWIGGFLLGNANYHNNMGPFYTVDNLSTYPSVDPSTARGLQLMDAGRALFAPGTRLDLTKSMGFRNIQTYCVAPITLGTSPLGTYDFWAIGTDCCSGNSGDFHCGEYMNPHANAGLRLMNDDQRAFYRLAVQQAEARYQIQALHPVFFYWMEDPVAEMNAYQDDGFRFMILAVVGFFVVQIALTIGAGFLFANVSDQNW